MSYEDIRYFVSTSQTTEITTDFENASDITYSANFIIPSQLWKGYYDEKTFKSTAVRPTQAQYVNYGKSVFNYGCAVCCCAGAARILTSKTHTLDEMYRLGTFSWNPKTVDKYGSPNGPTLARWYQMRQIGISVNNGGVHYDAQRTYPWTKGNNAYQTLSTSTASLSEFYVPADTSIVYNQGTGNYSSGKRDALLAQEDFCKSQVVALKKLQSDLSGSTAGSPTKCDIIYVCSSKRKLGHYLLAIAYSQQHSGQYSVDDVTVLDPCPTKISRDNYYGVSMTLPNALKRLNADISDGIRLIYKVSAI